MHSRTISAAGALALILAVAGCSSNGAASATTRAGTASSTSTSHAATSVTVPRATSSAAGSPSTTGSVRPVTPATTSAASTTVPPTTAPEPVATGAPVTGGVDPNAPEVVEPGDIPDNQAFIPYASPDGTFTIKVPEGWARTDQPGGVLFTDKYNSISISSATAASAPDAQTVITTGLADVSADPTFQLGTTRDISRPAGPVVLVTYTIGSPPNPVTGKKALLAVERYVYFHNGRTVTLTLSGAKGADNVDPWKVVSDSLTWSA